MILRVSASGTAPRTVLEETGTRERRLRDLPSRVGVYFVLALGLFPLLGYQMVWQKLTAALGGQELPCPSGKALRDLRRRIGTAPVKALFEVLAGPAAQPFRLALEMEQIPEESNYVTIDTGYRGRLGNFRPVIRYDLPDYVRAGMAAAKEASDQIFAWLGVPPLRLDPAEGPVDDPDLFPFPPDYTRYEPTDPGYLTYRDTGYSSGGAGHAAGTHRMGGSPRTSVVDSRQRSWDHDNLYLVGCGNMPTVGTSNPTLTMTALAIWAGENIVEDLRRRL